LAEKQSDQPASPPGEDGGADDSGEDEGIRRGLADQRDERDADSRQQRRKADADADLDQRGRELAGEALRQPGTEDIPDTPPPRAAGLPPPACG
jgi:hypothetical protein